MPQIFIYWTDLNWLRTLNGSKDTYIESIVEDASHHMGDYKARIIVMTQRRGKNCFGYLLDFMEATEQKIHSVKPLIAQNFLLIGISGWNVPRYDVVRQGADTYPCAATVEGG